MTTPVATLLVMALSIVGREAGAQHGSHQSGSPLILIAPRLLQGVAVSGEWAGSSC
jgi:hypothetical protein